MFTTCCRTYSLQALSTTLKKAPYVGAFLYGAQKRTRTSTPLTGPAPETDASTNFAIWAQHPKHIKKNYICQYKIKKNIFFAKNIKKDF